MKLVLLGILSLKSYEQSPNNKTYFNFLDDFLFSSLYNFGFIFFDIFYILVHFFFYWFW